MEKTHISIIGIRGYNSIYSGFETFVRQLVKGADKNRFSFSLFCRHYYQRKSIHGPNFKTVRIPSISDKYLETLIYVIFSTLFIIMNLNKTEIILLLGLANTPTIFLFRALGYKTIVNTDGLDWQRARWNWLGKFYLKFCERLVVLFADVIVCDSKAVLNYFSQKYSLKNLTFIPYGAKIRKLAPGRLLAKLDLQVNKYFYCCGRITPENSFEDVILAYQQVADRVGDYKCVIIGDSVYEDRYKNYLLNLAKHNKKIVFTGFLTVSEYEEVCSNALFYVETKGIGGTHPSLLEAMAFNKRIIARDIVYHREVLGNKAVYYKTRTELANKLSRFLLANNQSPKKSLYSDLLKGTYSWQKVIASYATLFYKL